MRTRISSQVDHDLRHYSFPRSSGLPVGYFDTRRTLPDGWVLIIVVLCGIVAAIVTV